MFHLDNRLLLEKIHGKLIVSCQALKDEPLHSSKIMGKMALAAQQGGASGIRANSVEDIIEIRKNIDLPIIGIIKANYSDSNIYITPTLTEIRALVDSPAEIIAMDATERKRPAGSSLQEMLEYVKKSGKLAMADISTLEEGVNAQRLGFNLVSTTLSGYVGKQAQGSDKPDFELIRQLKDLVRIPVIAEGRIKTPQELVKAIQCGAYCAVIGSIITRPQIITRYFASALEKMEKQ